MNIELAGKTIVELEGYVKELEAKSDAASQAGAEALKWVVTMKKSLRRPERLPKITI